MKTLKIGDLVELLKGYDEFKDVTKKDIKLVIEATFNEIKEQVLAGNSCRINDFGSFTKATREGVVNTKFVKNKKFKTSRVAFRAFKACKA